MKAFLTGGTGFVGSHLAEELLERGFRVSAMVRNEPRWLAGLDVEHVRCDTRQFDALCRGLEGSDYVFHVAGMTRAPTREALFAANVDATAALLEAVRVAAPGVRRVVVASSQAAVGPSPVENRVARPVTEDDPLRPISLYGESKAEMERMIATQFDDVPITVVRPSAVYGPREADIFTVIKTAARLRVFPIVGSGRRPRLSLIHVRDLVSGMADAALSNAALGETFFIGSQRAYSWNEIRDAVSGALVRRLVTIPVASPLVAPIGAVVEGAGSLLGKYPPLNREKAREAREAWVCSIEKARRVFDYVEQVRLPVGMAETVAWYRREGWL